MPHELTPFFEQDCTDEKLMPKTPLEALNEAQQYAFSRLISREMAYLRRDGHKLQDMETLSINATQDRCTEASYRMAYHLWRNASHLFRKIFILEAERGRTQPTVFSMFPESTTHTGVIAEDIKGRWYFISPANDNGTDASLLKKRIEEESLEKLVSEVERQNVAISSQFGVNRLFPTATEIEAQLQQDGARKTPEIDPLDLSQESELRNQDQWYTGQYKYISLDATELDLLEEDPENLKKCEVLNMPTIRRKTASSTTFDPPRTSSQTKKLIVPKE